RTPVMNPDVIGRRGRLARVQEIIRLVLPESVHEESTLHRVRHARVRDRLSRLKTFAVRDRAAPARSARRADIRLFGHDATTGWIEIVLVRRDRPRGGEGHARIRLS